ncbi:MAG: hypothetical protein ACHREM_24295, partial [Polyangiales bacterium]
MPRLSRKRVLAIVIVVAPIVLVLRTFAAAPLPRPPPIVAPLPIASSPSTMALFHLPTGVTHRSAAFAYRGGSFCDARDFAMSAALVRHPKGDLLIDTGFGRTIDAQIKLMPWLFRAATRYTRAT